jgi:hypothetical protein
MAGPSAKASAGIVTENESGTNYRSAFIGISSLFFMWGFITCLNDIHFAFYVWKGHRHGKKISVASGK